MDKDRSGRLELHEFVRNIVGRLLLSNGRLKIRVYMFAIGDEDVKFLGDLQSLKCRMLR